MKPEEELVWKLIDRNISEAEFKELQKAFVKTRELRKYYQDCIETHAILESYVEPDGKTLHFPSQDFESGKSSIRTPAWLGWVAAALIFFYFGLTPTKDSNVKVIEMNQPDWRGTELSLGSPVPNKPLHLMKGSLEIQFPSQTKAVVNGPAIFQVQDDQTLEMIQGKVSVVHRGKPGTFSLLTPAGTITELGTRFTAVIKNNDKVSTVHTEVVEGKIRFENPAAKKNRIFSVGESALITGTNRNARIEIEIFPTQNVSPIPINPLPDKELKQPDFQAIDLMLEGNLEAQIKYSFIEAIAATIDEKARILTDAELEFTGKNKISFAEAAMPEIEAMASSIVDSCVDFSKIAFWEACQTAEITWDEKKNQNGVTTHFIPHTKRLPKPKEGNRLLENLQRIRDWVSEVHLVHQKKGMGWASTVGCPEDGKSIFDRRNKTLVKISYAIDSIKSNLD